MANEVTATVDDFRAEFPEFAAVDTATIEANLRRAKRIHTATKAGTIYAAAHLYSLDKASKEVAEPAQADGGFGVIKKETIGPKSVEYSTTAGDESRKVFWATTPYGREFMLIEQRNVRQGFGMLIG